MVRLINKLTGGDMWVADARVDEYLAAGHKLAAESANEIMNPPEVETNEEQDDAPVKKYTTRRRKKV